MTENEIGTTIIAAAMRVHSSIGPGLLENVYELCLAHELTISKVPVSRQVPVAIQYGDLCIENAYRMDLLVDQRIVVEVKSVDTIAEVHRSQLLGYLRLGKFKLGYLLNFNVAHMREGIVRLVNGL